MNPNLPKSAPPRTRTVHGLLPLLALAAIGMVSVAGAGLQQEPDPVDETRNTLREWVQTRTVIDTERAEWAVEKEMLGSQIELVGLEITRLRESIATTQEELETANKEASELQERDEQFAATEAGLLEIVSGLEDRVRGLLQRLPEKARNDVRLFAQRLPEDSSTSELKTGERFMTVVAILNSLNKTHRDLDVTNERRDLPDGSSKEVSTLYLGLSHAWYASADGLSGGYGRATADGWVWVPANDYAAEILLAIQIQQNEKSARYVRLPMTIE